MNNIEKVKFVVSVFHHGGMNQLEQDWAISTAAIIGLQQGLKYNGNIKRGVQGGVAVLGVMYVANGLNNVIGHRQEIKKAFTKED
ncbi:MAG: hypothetical protein K9L62_01950 [Vallitaleaceae bacterium]|nr:hypothetical protein [Vallitaleaceae bacterium]